MSSPSDGAPDRPIPHFYDAKGDPVWPTTMSPPDPSVGVCMMVPDRIIPVIFLPGVMGSNLKSTADKDVKWRLDSKGTMLPWLARDAKARKQYLTPQGMKLDNEGKLPSGTAQSSSELKARGWGEISYFSYADFLVWLENALSDFDNAKHGLRDQLIGVSLGAVKGEAALNKAEVGLSYRYRFPVWVCGYNWLASNADSAKQLKDRIKAARDRYRSEGKKCDKVILITHSMGGLVARYCSEALGASAQIHGIVHGVMPAIGAAAVYRRMKSGTEYDGFAGFVASQVLGGNAAEVTAVLSSAPGPLQLLPTPEYGKGWLRIDSDGHTFSLPQAGDPYGEIYTVRGQWWSLCDDQLVNPFNEEVNPRKHQLQVDADWLAFGDVIHKIVKPFHQQIAGKYHPNTYAFYGASQAHLAYGNVTWRGGSSWGESWLGGGRAADPLHGRALDPNELYTGRSITAPLAGTGWKTSVHQHYTVSDPEEPGDGTVPQRSGVAPKAHMHSLLTVVTDHGDAYNAANEAARRFVLRAVVKIAQRVKGTALAYD